MNCVMFSISKLSAFSISAVGSFPFVFFFNDTATTEIYTLSLHDALPISRRDRPGRRGQRRGHDRQAHRRVRSEEHTSELQSRVELVCRLLLENKKETADAAVQVGGAETTVNLDQDGDVY